MSEEAPTPKLIDLSTYTEATRRAVYDAVVAIFFSPTPEEIAAFQADPENHPTITYSPDEAGLKIYHELGRWIVTWTRLEFSADIPEEFRRELLLVEEVPTAPHGRDIVAFALKQATENDDLAHRPGSWSAPTPSSRPAGTLSPRASC